MLNKGADIDIKNRGDWTPLCIATSKLAKISENYEAKTSEKHIKSSEKCVELITFLLSNGANPNQYEYNNKALPLMFAARACNTKALALLLPVTETKNIEEPYDSPILPWYTPLMFESLNPPDAPRSKSKEWIPVLRLLKQYGADLNTKYGYTEETLLHKVIRSFPSFKIKKIQPKEKTALNRYKNLLKEKQERFNDDLKKLNFLLENGADPRVVRSEDNRSALHTLIAETNLDFMDGAIEQLIDRFLNKGVNINTPDKDGYTPLHIAVSVGRIAAIKYLIIKGANVNARTKNGDTPLTLATDKKSVITELLINTGANIANLNNNQTTLLPTL